MEAAKLASSEQQQKKDEADEDEEETELSETGEVKNIADVEVPDEFDLDDI